MSWAARLQSGQDEVTVDSDMPLLEQPETVTSDGAVAFTTAR
jgi:hypothetical protein